MLDPLPLPPPNSKCALGLKILLVFSWTLLLIQMLDLGPPSTHLRKFSCLTPTQPAQPPQTKHHQEPPTPIPNIVHFVHLVNPSEKPILLFPLRQFIAIYSASHYLHPTTIYIHTNLKQSLLQAAINTSADSYVRAISAIPNVKFNHIDPKTRTSKGQPIDNLPNQSDFVRTNALRKHGGIYLDDDAYVLRDLSPFRTAGFENVIGRQANGQACPAVMLAAPKNSLMKAYYMLQDAAFDGGWATHATDLLTTLIADFSPPDRQVLILPQDTFFPSKWEKADLKDIYQIHPPSSSPHSDLTETLNNSTQDMKTFVKDFKLKPSSSSWQRDWRLSYVLHGWTKGIGDGFDERERKELFGKFGEIDMDYVLSRRSNFARAVEPALRHALESGVLVQERFRPLEESSEVLE